jgi:hypothetical protein
LHAPLTQTDPLAHCAVAQEGTHCPSSHTSPEAHWLVYSQAFVEAVHAPATQTCPVEHSVFTVQGQGPSVPPQVGPASCPASGGGAEAPASVATHTFASHVKPTPQSAFVVHSTSVPGDEPGATQYPALHRVPCGQVLLEVQVCSHPFVVQADPVGHPVEPVHAVAVGGGTEAHEYPSHV